MATETHTVTLTGTGNQSYSGFSFMPTCIEFLSSQEGSGVDTLTRFSAGVYDDITGVQRADSTFRDGTGAETEKSTTRCVLVLDRNGANIDPKVECEFVSFDNLGGGDYGVTLNQINCSIAVQQRIRIYA